MSRISQSDAPPASSSDGGSTELLPEFKGVPAADPIALLTRAAELFGRSWLLCSSFSLEDNVVLHMMSEIAKQRGESAPRVAALDTGRLPEETLACAEQIKNRFDVKIEWQYPDPGAVKELVASKGLYSFRESVENRKECCGIRKVVPLKLALAGLKCWVTGLRKSQSVTRVELAPVEIDSAHGGIFKLNPIAELSYEEVFDYTKRHQIPYNSLYDHGYRSIGCAPCTRAIRPGEHERAGRWWWESPEHRECGIHLK